ncbi:hypothetical protein COEREDRAFT_90225 [Coemansia reversa NRRL 1564]|uniref:PCI domain-containing protein n=1 Tax=Coemansia reversa (strain ATCC 12441 / NRRL 1564) TaxID=763665 RepID=A0A2G5BKB3_COERN|nr:hypothetical protein COEREDRAFT_90225 [Coemansia reversa NRRL 1564]|eukprot:PIA19474.1 hypothetical protein COEREDRAFT_90225 [Coemansia reversa NRRL 1564]
MSNSNKAASMTAFLFVDPARSLKLLQHGIAVAETHYIYCALCAVPSLRKRLLPEVLAETIAACTSKTDASNIRDCLKGMFMLLKQDQRESQSTGACEPELCPFLGLLLLLSLLDSGDRASGAKLTESPISMDGRLHEVHPALVNALQAATLAGMKETKAMLLTVLLRNYMHYKHYDQAERLTAKSSFPSDAPNNLLAHYLYYLGHIEAIQLKYSHAQMYLLEATCKVPSNAEMAGFQQTVQKIYVIVELLMGNISERSLFCQPPYLELAQVVRVSDLNKFQDAVAKYKEKLLKDNVLILIQRLRHNVIKAGICSISIAYSRISLRDICLKLHLDSEEDAEYIVAKAIRDGVVDAMVDHEKGFVQSSEIHNVYSTNDPQYAFDKQIAFCLSLYNDSVKSMRYPGSDHRKELAYAMEAIKRERELAHELENDDYDGDLDEDAMDEDL